MLHEFGILLKALITAGCLAAAVVRVQEVQPRTVLFESVRIFDGKGSTLSVPSNMLVQGNTIQKISTVPIPVDRSADTRIIRGSGRTLMPGLIDAHWHAVPLPVLITAGLRKERLSPLEVGLMVGIVESIKASKGGCHSPCLKELLGKRPIGLREFFAATYGEIAGYEAHNHERTIQDYGH